MKKYKPTPEDIQWAKTIIAMTKDGGNWLWPDLMSIFTFNHRRQTLTYVAGFANLSKNAMNRTTEVFRAVGYEVIWE